VAARYTKRVPSPPESTRGRWYATLAAVGVAIALSRWLTRATSPDGFDSIDFLLGMSKGFDLARLQPHFPGYPVYVALGAGLCRLGVPALAAAVVISAAASGGAAVAIGVSVERLAGRTAAVVAMALHGVAWLPWLLGAGALSDPLGLAFAAGLLLGTRASYWPLVASFVWFAWRSSRAPAFAAGWVTGTLIWAVPFFAVVGVGPFISLGRAHLAGHFSSWGRTVASEHGLGARTADFARDWFYDGFAPAPWALAGLALLLVAVVVRERRRGRAFPVGGVLAWVAALAVPYAVWTFAAQNVIEQPRHLLPLVELSLALFAVALSRWPLAAGAAVVLMSTVSAPLAWERHRTPSAGAQASAWVAQNATPADSVIMADRSWRFFTELPGAYPVRQHAWLSEVTVDLSRFDRFPPLILLTSEIDLHSGTGPERPLPRQWRVEPGPQFCRDGRIDRADPCLALSTLHWAPH
jgi:hypothetical protein